MHADDPDKQLIRVQGGTHLNLAVGEPFFLHGPLEDLVYGDRIGLLLKTYPELGGSPGLLEELRLRHPDASVVVANGAKQALLASLYALKKLGYGTTFYHRAPHWPSYPTMATMSGVDFRKHANDAMLRVNTSPNNPDGSVSTHECDILDAAYCHSVYGWDGRAPRHEISVWSAAKLFGLSSLRVGWLVTKDVDLAAAAAEYVEKTTSGVNTEAQVRIQACLESVRENPIHWTMAYYEARQQLLANAQAFNELLTPHCEVVKGLPANLTGMFAWFRVKDIGAFGSALAAAKVLVVDGRACGATEPGWYRMSLGQTPDVIRKALTRLSEEMP